MARRWSTGRRLGLLVVVVVAIVSMHGSAADAHACAPVDHVAERHDGHRNHEPAAAGGTAPLHCGATACSAATAPAHRPETTRVPGSVQLLTETHQSPAGISFAPEPPVPRLLVRT